MPQIVAKLGKTDRAIESLIYRKRIPHYRIDGRIWFDEDEIDLWTQKRAEKDRHVSIEEALA